MVEHVTENHGVAGSIPALATRIRNKTATFRLAPPKPPRVSLKCPCRAINAINLSRGVLERARVDDRVASIDGLSFCDRPSPSLTSAARPRARGSGPPSVGSRAGCARARPQRGTPTTTIGGRCESARRPDETRRARVRPVVVEPVVLGLLRPQERFKRGGEGERCGPHDSSPHRAPDAPRGQSSRPGATRAAGSPTSCASR